MNPSTPPCLYLVSAFFAMEPNSCLISLARECGGGSITKGTQSLIWEHCINKAMNTHNAPSKLYGKNFVKKLIVEVESSGDEVLDELYEHFAHCITSIKDDILVKGNTRVCKTFSFIFPDGCVEVPSCPISRKLEVPLQCSLNMLEGDTGCSVWPSSLYLSEFILSFPEIFTAKSCFEVGSGVGLVGICLTHVKAYEVILTDGDMSTLANLKHNLTLNNLKADSVSSKETSQDTNMLKCKYLSWELASGSDLQVFTPDVVLGADVIYDPVCFPHLIRVLSILLKPKTANLHKRKGTCMAPNYTGFIDNHISNDLKTSNGICRRNCNSNGLDAGVDGVDATSESCSESQAGPIAYIATVIRNVDTYNYFLDLAAQAQLLVVDITGNQKPLSLLPYMQTYDRASVRLLTISNL